MTGFFKFRFCSLGAVLFASLSVPAPAYSLFTHEQLIDLSWNQSIRPLLLTKYPGTSEQALRRAHAYAYGGCVIQDLGYYPFGQAFFSDLTHYVRSGDFIMQLLLQSRNVDDYAFALGALSHYIGDNIGHKDAINPATALEFPKLRQKFGESVTYDQNPHAHVRAEFGFDIDQLSKHRLAPSAYLRYIGLLVSRPLLERAFEKTYALNLNEVLGVGRRPSFRTYRWAVRTFLPRVAYAETVLHRDQFAPDSPNAEFDLYSRHLADADFQKLWNPYRRKPGFQTYAVAFVIRILPKVGPLSIAAIRVPSVTTQEIYIRSVNRTVGVLSELMHRLAAGGDTAPFLANRDLDTGDKSKPGAYPLTDRTYAKLVHSLATGEHTDLPPDLKSDVVAFYSDPAVAISRQTATDLNTLHWTLQ